MLLSTQGNQLAYNKTMEPKTYGVSGTTDNAPHNINFKLKYKIIKILIMAFPVQIFHDVVFTTNLIKVQNQHQQFHRNELLW